MQVKYDLLILPKMKTTTAHKGISVALLLLVLGFIVFAGASSSQYYGYQADVTAVEVEIDDIDEEANYHTLLTFTLNIISSASASLEVQAPELFSSSTGFHSVNKTGKSICICLGQLKFDC